MNGSTDWRLSDAWPPFEMFHEDDKRDRKLRYLVENERECDTEAAAAPAAADSSSVWVYSSKQQVIYFTDG